MLNLFGATTRVFSVTSLLLFSASCRGMNQRPREATDASTICTAVFADTPDGEFGTNGSRKCTV